MEIKDIKNGRYGVVSGILKFDTNIGQIEIKAAEAMEIVWTLFDYANLDYNDRYSDLEERLFDEIDVMVKERKKLEENEQNG